MRRRAFAKRWEPTTLVLALCVLASLGIHVPVYEGLGALSAWWASQEPDQRSLSQGTTESSNNEVDITFEEVATPDAAKGTPSRQTTPDSRAQTKPRQELPSEQKPEEKKETPEIVERRNRLAVKQEQDESNEEPPPDARFVAEQSRRVEKETVARDLSDQSQSARSDGASERDPAPPGEEQNNETSEGKRSEGAPQETSAKEPMSGDKTRGDKASKQDAQRDAQNNQGGASSNRPGGSAGNPGRGGTASGGDGSVVLDDGNGSFRIRGGLPPGSGSSAAAEEILKRGAGRLSDAGGRFGSSFSDNERVVGEDVLRREREKYLAERRRMGGGGGNRSQQWKKFIASVENYVPGVKSGNQTALNAARNPFASYISDMHRKIHPRFAYGFLTSIPGTGTDPLADASLFTTLEIVLSADGTVHKIGVVRASGVLVFDHGAYSSVDRAQPFGKVPDALLSKDGRMYVHWNFHRDERQCGTFNARPFLLNN